MKNVTNKHLRLNIGIMRNTIDTCENTRVIIYWGEGTNGIVLLDSAHYVVVLSVTTLCVCL